MYLYVYVCIYVFEEGVGFEGLLPSPAFWFLNRIHNIYFYVSSKKLLKLVYAKKLNQDIQNHSVRSLF